MKTGMCYFYTFKEDRYTPDATDRVVKSLTSQQLVPINVFIARYRSRNVYFVKSQLAEKSIGLNCP